MTASRRQLEAQAHADDIRHAGKLLTSDTLNVAARLAAHNHQWPTSTGGGPGAERSDPVLTAVVAHAGGRGDDDPDRWNDPHDPVGHASAELLKVLARMSADARRASHLVSQLDVPKRTRKAG